MALNLTFWDNQQNPVNTTVEQLFDALRNDDMKAGLMYEPCTMDDVLDGTEPSNALIMDAIIAQYAKLTVKMNIMQRVMSRSGVDVKDSEGKTVPLTVVGYQISDPFMRLGTANVVALFELSDGQTVSIYFHNPDTTPKKITPQDEVISFKWLLNKKDITIVVAPEKGKDIDVRQVALRIMKIAAKNSAAFARQNKNRKERLERVNTLRTRVAEKEKILAQKLKKIDELQYLKAQEEVDQLLEDERLMNSELNASLYAELKALDRLSDREDELDNIYQARVVAVRNMLRDKGWKGESYKELSKEGYVLTETYHYSKSGTNMIGVTYSIPELNLSYTDELTDTPEAIAEMINEPVDKALKALRLSQVESDKEEDKEQPIVISGNEFGEFDTETAEGKIALREKAFEHIKQLVDNEESVFCSALNANVFFSQKGNRKYKSESKGELGPIKSQLAFKLKELIASGKQYKESAESYDEKEQRSRLKYHYLKTNAIVGNQELTVKLVIRETPEKTFHYDLQLEKGFDQIFDSVDAEMATMPFLRLSQAGGNCSHSLGQNDLYSYDTPILDGKQVENILDDTEFKLDDADSNGYVLNLFVEYKDENGNWVELKDEDEEVEPENSNAQPETIQSTPVLLHTSLLYKGEGYRPFLPGRDEEIEQFKQAGYMLEPFSVEGRSCTYSVHKTAEPYNIHITANWYSDGEKSYWINVSPQKGYVTDVKENNGGQAKVAGANENAKSVTDAIQLAEELIQEEKHYRPLRKAAPTLNGYYQATKGRSKTHYFNVWHNQEESEYGAYIQWSAGGKEEIKASSEAELKQKVETFFRTYVKGNLPEIVFVKGEDILGITPKETINETVDDNLPELVLPENASRKELAEVVENWLKANLQGKIIKTVDNKTVAFNRSDSVKHLSFDGSRSVLAAKAATKVAEIFSTGQFIERQTLNKERNDKFVAFHLYEKTVEIDKNMVKIQAKAGEKLDGTLETLPNLLAYHHKVILDDGNKNAIIDFAGFIGTENRQEPPPPNNGMNDNTAILDDVQEEDLLATLIILEIRDKEGNLIDLDQLDEQEENEVEENAVNNAIELDEQKQADIQFLQDVIDCKIDVLADDFYNKLEPIATRVYDYNEELVSKAVDAYANKTDEYAIATE
ncbi:hypothetical protein [Avibacterium paragallinarum]|uniref:defense against restriction DarA-related protein n=1 Tax=Avibacterium paragallinarum TaxID=728 RepID=UPI00034A2756|nr:hypothetical protein [Avibacterium paragallinarum]